MKLRYILIFCILICSLVLTLGKRAKEKETIGKEKDKEKPEKEKKEDKPKEEKVELDEEKASNNSRGEDDYDTTQGYPILYPETHMMQIKRNLTSSLGNATTTNVGVLTDVDDDETYEANLNKSRRIEDIGKCTKSLDLLFVLDSSESVKFSNWKIIIQFVKELANRFTLHSSRVGIIRYASEAEVALPLTQFNDTQSRDSAIDDIFYKTGGTRTDIALKKASEVFKTEDQRSQVLMLVTDGPTNRLEINKDHFVEGADLVAGPAYKLKQAGVALFCIGVEPDSETPEEVETMKEEMRVIASEPTKQHLFLSDGYHELERKVEYISKAACVVNGGWSIWSEYSPCSVTCGFGTKVRMRTCTNPKPENNGADCTGVRVETEECDLGPCNSNEPNFLRPPTESKVIVRSTESPVFFNSTIKITTLTTTATTPAPLHANNTSVRIDTNNDTLHAVAVKPKNDSNGKIAELMVPHGGSACYDFEEVKLSDSQYNASSVYTHDTDDEYLKREYAPLNARLNNMINGGGWCAEHRFATSGDKNQYLQFNLGKQMTIHAVATQGSHLLDNWVTSYNLRYSDDGISWEYYIQNPLEGNKDRSEVRKHMLAPPIVARYVQINPIEWNEDDGGDKHDICMRAALYKCRDLTKTGITRSKVYRATLTYEPFPSHKATPRGVVIREQATPVWAHYPSQKTSITLVSYKRQKRQHGLHRGHKRILYKIRKAAKHVMRKMKSQS